MFPYHKQTHTLYMQAANKHIRM